MKKFNKGFTLVELIIVMVLLRYFGCCCSTKNVQSISNGEESAEQKCCSKQLLEQVLNKLMMNLLEILRVSNLAK